MSNEWSSVDFQLSLVKQVLQVLQAVKGVLSGGAIISDTVGTFLETISPLALLQQGSSFLVDNSAVTEALIGLVTGLNEDVAELYVHLPQQRYQNRSFTGLMDLFVESIQYRHQGTIGAHIPGINSIDATYTPGTQAEIELLEDSLNTGLRDLTEFTGFALVGTSGTFEGLSAISASFQALTVNSIASPGRMDLPQPRVYNWGQLITPYTVPSGQIFTPIWELIKSLDTIIGFTETVNSAFKKLQELGQLLGAKAESLRAIVAKIDELNALILTLIPPEGTLAAITFSKLSIDELRECLQNSANEPDNPFAVGMIAIVSDPGVVDLFESLQ